jgi:hypothetical protein
MRDVLEADDKSMGLVVESRALEFVFQALLATRAMLNI